MSKTPHVCVALAFLMVIFSAKALAGTCNVSQQCSNGSTVSCSGQSGTCTTGSNYVECSGTRKYCPSQPQPCGISYECEYGGTLTCYSEEGRCYTYEFETFGCDDAVMSCAECYPRFFCSF
jgi:hypothetical protein